MADIYSHDEQSQMTNEKPFYVQQLAEMERQLEIAKYTEAELRSLERRFEDEKAIRRRTEEQLAEVKNQLADARKAAQWQKKMVLWVESRLGINAMDPHERTLRFAEESIELMQACGLQTPEVARICSHVFSRPCGVVDQEIGGVISTLLTLSDAHNCNMLDAAEKEITRIHTLPPEKFQKRQELNVALGIGNPINLPAQTVRSTTPPQSWDGEFSDTLPRW